jgi:hypothetical protein
MFEKKYEDRLLEWKQFRKQLDTSNDPLQEVFDFYSQAPLVTIQTDPWDQNSWPEPWELLKENIYCPFVKILAICYTLQLTERFSQCQFQIHITQDEENIRYLLTVGDACIGYGLGISSFKNISKNLIVEKTYIMPPLQ